MAHLVLKSNFNEAEFRTAVENHAAELAAWDKHMTNVRAGNAQFYPPPATHPDVEASICREQQPDGSVKLTIDYEMVDHMPVARDDHRALDQRKSELWHAIIQMEQTAIGGMLSPAKWRLASLRYNAAKGRVVSTQISPDETDLVTVAEHEARMERTQRMQLHFAEQASEVEDLTFDTVNGWKPRPFEDAAP